MSRFVVFKGPSSLLVCENKFDSECKIHVFQIKCQECKECAASDLECLEVRNEEYCEHISKNIETCKSNAIKGGLINNKNFKGIHRCCDFSTNDISYSRDHIDAIDNKYKKSV